GGRSSEASEAVRRLGVAQVAAGDGVGERREVGREALERLVEPRPRALPPGLAQVLDVEQANARQEGEREALLAAAHRTRLVARHPAHLPADATDLEPDAARAGPA